MVHAVLIPLVGLIWAASIRSDRSGQLFEHKNALIIGFMVCAIVVDLSSVLF